MIRIAYNIELLLAKFYNAKKSSPITITMHEFTPKTFFHHIKKTELLKKFFIDVHGLSDFPTIAEDIPRREMVDAITDFYNNIPQDKRGNIDKDLVTVNRMSSERGVSLLNEMAQKKGELVELQEYLDEGFHDRALFFYLQKSEIFKEAITIDEFFDQQGWKRYPVPKKSFDTIEGKKEELRKEFEKMFKEETRGRTCLVDMYRYGALLYTVITFEDYPQVGPQMDASGEVDRMGFFRPLKQVYFLYTPDDDELQIKYRGNWQELEKYLTAFLRIVFNKPLEKMGRTYNLDVFKNRNFIPDYGEHAGIVEMWILRLMDLEFIGSKKKVLLKVPVKNATKTGMDDMWDLLDTLGLSRRMNEIRINKVDASIRFKNSKSKTGATTKPFFINWKDTCSLGTLDEFERMANKILETSKIDNGFGKKNTE